MFRGLFIAVCLSVFAGTGVASEAPKVSLGTPKTGQSEPFVHHDACFGDRCKSDKELNEGNAISDKEILDLLNAMTQPGV